MSPRQKEITPMGPVWLVVLGTMMLTGLLLWGWHVVVYSTKTAEQRVESAQLRAEIARLGAYVDDLDKKSTSTAPAQP